MTTPARKHIEVLTCHDCGGIFELEDPTVEENRSAPVTRYIGFLPTHTQITLHISFEKAITRRAPDKRKRQDCHHLWNFTIKSEWRAA